MTMVLAATALLVVFMLGVNVGGELMSAAWDRANNEIIRRVFAPTRETPTPESKNDEG